MAQISISLLFLLLTTSSATSTTTSPTDHHRSRARAFIIQQCNSTRFPPLCIQYLSNSSLQTPQHLAQTALTVTLTKAQSTKSYVISLTKHLNQTKIKEYQAIKDCLDQITDGVSQITQSIKELKMMGGATTVAFGWHESNVKSWVSAALTDAVNCVDEIDEDFVDGKVKEVIKVKVLNVAQLTSLSLALFNRFAAKHGGAASGADRKP